MARSSDSFETNENLHRAEEAAPTGRRAGRKIVASRKGESDGSPTAIAEDDSGGLSGEQAWDTEVIPADGGETADERAQRSVIVAPRKDTSAEEFELNTAAVAATNALSETDWLHAPDDLRVREAIRRIIEDGQDTDVVARALALAPSSVAKWRQKYAHYVSEQAGLNQPQEWDWKHEWQGDNVLPAEWKIKFSENWQHLLDEMHATAADFVQDPLEIFLTQSTATGWLFREGKLDRHVVLGLVVGLGLFIVATTWFTTRGQHRQAEAPEKTIEESREAQNKEEIAKAMRVARDFLAADGWEKKASFVRDADRLRSAMRDWYSEHSDLALPEANFELGEIEGDVVRLAATFKTQDEPVMLALVKEADGYRVDWETSSGYQQRAWEDIYKKKPSEPFELRCVVESSDYYNYQFTDSSKWIAFELSYPRAPVKFVGYAPRNTPLGGELESLLVFNESVGLTLQVVFPERAGADQVKILSITGQTWMRGSAKTPDLLPNGAAPTPQADPPVVSAPANQPSAPAANPSPQPTVAMAPSAPKPTSEQPKLPSPLPTPAVLSPSQPAAAVMPDILPPADVFSGPIRHHPLPQRRK